MISRIFTTGIFFATTFAIASLSAVQSIAGTVQVGNCLSNVKQFTTIQDAVNASEPGTTIRVCPKKYPEQILISKTLTLSGVEDGTGSRPVVTSPAGGIMQNATSLATGNAIGAQILVQNASGVNIHGLTVDGKNNRLSCTLDLTGVYYQNASGTVNHVVTRNQELGSKSYCQSGEGIFLQSGYGYAESSIVTIENSSIHSYQKNGITADGDALTVTISGNDVVGHGPTVYVAQNGIQVSDGATGEILHNSVLNDIYTGTYYSATGVLVYASNGVTIKGNSVGNTQGVVVYSGGTAGSADGATITSNHVFDTDLYDGIDVCSDNNTVSYNSVFTSGESGIHLDDSCIEANGAASGSNNIAVTNTINDACAGLLLGSGANNTTTPNTIVNTDYVTLAGDFCSLIPSSGALAQNRRPKLDPARP